MSVLSVIHNPASKVYCLPKAASLKLAALIKKQILSRKDENFQKDNITWPVNCEFPGVIQEYILYTILNVRLPKISHLSFSTYGVHILKRQ